ncbi:MAG TPA: aminotransferase class V-fold PLP-dependent enzyme, partial [Actinomycetota bacterium]|nr:aminotransferase class V-fold PLP-dependent enzyme [Actinomycetota bacterium]
ADVAGLGCDFLVAGCHKWLFGPRGTGLVWGRREAWDEVTGTIPSFDRGAVGAWIGGRAPDGPRAALFAPGGFHAFEHRWALAEAFGFHLQLGKRQVAERTRALASASRTALPPSRRSAWSPRGLRSCRPGSSAWTSATSTPTRPSPAFAARASWPVSPPTPPRISALGRASSPPRPTSTPPSAPSTPSPERSTAPARTG